MFSGFCVVKRCRTQKVQQRKRSIIGKIKRLPNIEQLYDDRSDIINLRNEKNAQFKKVVSEFNELDIARSEIQTYLGGIDKDKRKKKELE